MRRLILLLVCFVLSYVAAFCQDIITRSDGVKIEANIIETRLYQISFKRFAEPQGPTYIINTADVLSVEYANGEKRVFEPQPASTPSPSIDDYEKSLGRNILSFRLFDIFYSNFSLAYERISAQGKFGIKIPVSVGLSGRNDQNYNYEDYNRNKTFSSGLELNFYPNGQGRFRYFIGPALQVGFFKFNYFVYDSDYTKPPVLKKFNGTHIALLVNNSIYYQFTPSFVVSLDGGIGMRSRSIDDDINLYGEYHGTSLHISGNLNLGIRF